jgi:DNA-binding winged helix-turn-helix (wHTH) protein/TolB-like protein/Tfp pilus assembly protein PilF
VTPAGTDVRILRFAAFELDVRQDELRRGGVLIKLSPQQLRVLRYLAEHAGTIAAREQIQREIWGQEVFVDFDRSLNVCIAQIRAALNDDSEAPRFIQTVPRRGYRFLAPVEQVTDVTAPVPILAETRPPARSHVLVRVAIAVAVLVTIAALVWLRAGNAPAARVVLAVLPFENVTQNAGDTAAIDGLSDELITQFGTAVPERLGVIGRTSVMRLAARKAGVAEMGRELSAAYLLEGDLRSVGARVRISARLVKVADQAQVWSETYEMEDASRLETEEAIAARVTAAVVAALFPLAPRSSTAAHVPARAAYEAFVSGRYLQQKRTRADTDRATQFFEQAGQFDSAYAEPWAAMAESYVGLALSGGSPDLWEKARGAAEHALRLSDANAEAHSTLGTVILWRDWNSKEARRHFARAIALNPSLAQAHHDYAFLLVVTGHAESGVAELRRAIAIDPLSPRVNVDAGWLLLQAHRFDEAIAQAKRALSLEPELPEAEACIARAEFHRGTASPGMMQFYQTRLESPDPYERALALAIAGRKAEAVQALREAYEKRQILMVMVGTEPAFTGLREEPGFREIVGKVWGSDALR